MSFTPEPGTPLAQYYAQAQPRDRSGPVSAQPRHAGRRDHRPLRHDHRRLRPEPLRPGGRTVGRVRRRRGATEHARRDRRVGYRHPRGPASARRNSRTTVTCPSVTATSGCA